MSGNVWEWCLDDYSYDNSKAIPDFLNGRNVSGSYRVSRGGSWDSYAVSCRSVYRGSLDSGVNYSNLGFRVALAQGQ